MTYNEIEQVAIPEIKRMLGHNKNHGLVMVDVSGRNSRGYTFALFHEADVLPPSYDQDMDKAILVSKTAYDAEGLNKAGTKGCYRPVFSRNEVKVLLNV